MLGPARTKAQTAYEFLFMFFFLTAAFTTWMIFNAQAQERLTEQRELESLEDLGLRLQEEFYTAQQMPDGFSRTITLPATLAQRTYNASIYEETATNTYLSIDNGQYTVTYTIPSMRTPTQPYELDETLQMNKSQGRLSIGNGGERP